MISSKQTLSDKQNAADKQSSNTYVSKNSIAYYSDEIPDEKEAQECVEVKMNKLNYAYEKRFFHQYPNGVKSPKQKAVMISSQL